jgi:hypothetical protein
MRFGSVVLHARRDTTTSGEPPHTLLPPHRLLPPHWRRFWRHVSPGDVLRAVVVAGTPTLAIAPARDALRTQPLELYRPYRRSG